MNTQPSPEKSNADSQDIQLHLHLISFARHLFNSPSLEPIIPWIPLYSIPCKWMCNTRISNLGCIQTCPKSGILLFVTILTHVCFTENKLMMNLQEEVYKFKSNMWGPIIYSIHDFWGDSLNHFMGLLQSQTGER